MLDPTKMMNDVMFAISMYFADALKRRLLQNSETFWPMLLIFSFITIWLRFEHFCANYKKTLPKPLKLGHDIGFQVVSLFSQTLLFLLVQVVVHIIDQSVSEQSLWMESILLPCFMILMCVIVVTVKKRSQPHEP